MYLTIANKENKLEQLFKHWSQSWNNLNRHFISETVTIDYKLLTKHLMRLILFHFLLSKTQVKFHLIVHYWSKTCSYWFFFLLYCQIQWCCRIYKIKESIRACVIIEAVTFYNELLTKSLLSLILFYFLLSNTHDVVEYTK